MRITDERAIWLSRHVLPHEPALRAWLRHRHSRYVDIIDDIVQETYARLASLASVAEVRNPRAYAFQTALSILVSHIRRSRIVSIRAATDVELLAAAAVEPSAEKQMEDLSELQKLAEVIASFPPRCREVFVLRRIEGLSQREVAKRLGLSENTVEHQMSKGIRILMDAFGRGGKAAPDSSKGGEQPENQGHDTVRIKPGY